MRPCAKIMPVDAAALVISIIAVIIAGLGTFLNDRRSKEALLESRKAVTTALWSAAQEAVQRFIGFDPNTEAVGERLANFRIAGIALADEYTDWDGLDTWLEAERVLGAVLAHEVIEVSTPRDTTDQRLDNLDMFMTWAQALSQNLRLLRSQGYRREELIKLRANAEDMVKKTCAEHGWDIPPTSNPRLKPLGD